MKKFKLTVTHDLLASLYSYLGAWSNENCISSVWEIRFTWVTIVELLESKKMRDSLHYTFKGEKKISLKANEAAALGLILKTQYLDPSDYLGLFLLNVYGDLDQYFTTINW